MRHALVCACALVLLTGCGHQRAGAGSATLWVTRDRGQTVMLTRTVPAGLTALQALDKETDVDTRYSGRFVQSIEGLKGDLSARRDWFWFLNGIESDRSAADYKLRPGDVEWWDYRSWQGEMRTPVVVGAFPEPFLHGWDGKVREVAIRYAPGQKAGAQAIGRLLHADSVRPSSEPQPDGSNVFVIETGAPHFTASLEGGVTSPVRFTFAGDAADLARHPDKFRFDYEVP